LQILRKRPLGIKISSWHAKAKYYLFIRHMLQMKLKSCNNSHLDDYVGKGGTAMLEYVRPRNADANVKPLGSGGKSHFVKKRSA
jgi:hypothetical protein